MVCKINKILCISLFSTLVIAIVSTLAKSTNLSKNSNVNRTVLPPQIISDKRDIQLSKEDIIKKSLEEYVIDVEVVEKNDHIIGINLIVENNITDNKIEILKTKMEEMYNSYDFLRGENVIKVNISDNQSIQEIFDIKESISNITLETSDNIIIDN